MVHDEHLLSSKNLEVWCVLGSGFLYDQSPANALGIEFLIRVSLAEDIPQVLSQAIAGKLGTSSVTPLGEDSCKFIPGFLWSSSRAPFSLLIWLCVLSL